MRTLVSSFRFHEALLRPDIADGPPYYQAPPVSFRRITDDFSPDYALLLLSDQIVMDKSSFERLVTDPLPGFGEVANTFAALKADGRIELQDYVSILDPHSDLLERMVAQDLATLDLWTSPLKQSLDLWEHFSRETFGLRWEQLIRDVGEDGARALSSHMRMPDDSIATHISRLVNEALASAASRKLRKNRDALRKVLRGYLTYVNSNLILANRLNASLHDWQDFTPFYSTKFLSIGMIDDLAHQGGAQLEQLFNLSFPDHAIDSPQSLIRALNDKRIDELRGLVADAVAGRVKFDETFAKSILLEIFHGEQQAKRWRSIVGYATLPLHLIPWVGSVAQKIAEEGLGKAVDHHFQREHRWFYLLSDIADRTS